MEDEVLKFKVTVDASGMKEGEQKVVAAFAGIKKAVSTLSGLSNSDLKRMSDDVKALAARWKDLSSSIGVSPTHLKQVLNYQREITRESERQANAAAKTAAAEAKKAIEIKKAADSAKQAAQASTRPGFGQGFSNALTQRNFGTFSNIAGAFGGGRGIGTIASALDGGFSGGGGGAAILGGLAGGAAIGGLIVAAGIIKSIGSNLVEAGKDAIQAAADYQVTKNSIAAFSGSMTEANSELEKLHETSRNTPGLAMQDAEKGYRNLRALGFAADTARGLIAGLAKQKLLSGADEASVNRVIVNLTQLSAGSSRASQDLREIFHALPSLRKEFFLAFGTLDPTKIAGEFARDSEGALQKISKQLEKSKGAQAGLNDATQKFSDAWTELERKFGEGALDGLTGGTKNLTKVLLDNKNVVADWGKYIGTAALYASRAVPAVLSLAEAWLKVARAGAAGLTFGTSELAIKGAQVVVGAQAENDDRRKLYNELVSQRVGSTVSITDKGGVLAAGIMSEDELNTRKSNTEYNSQQQKYKDHQDEIALSKEGYNVLSSITDNYYKLEEAKVRAHTAYTKAEQLNQFKSTSAIETNAIKARIQNAEGYYAKQIVDAEGNTKEIAKINLEKNKTLGDLQTELQLHDLTTQRDTSEKEREILQERRQANIEFLNQQISFQKFAADKVEFEVTRGIDRGNVSASEGYAKLRQIVSESYDSVLATTREAYQIQLANESLSVEQIRNIKQKQADEEVQLTEEKNRKILSLSDALYEKQKADLQRNFSEIKEINQSQGGVYGELGGLLNAGSFKSSTAGFLNKALGIDALNNKRGQVRQLGQAVEFAQSMGTTAVRLHSGSRCRQQEDNRSRTAAWISSGRTDWSGKIHPEKVLHHCRPLCSGSSRNSRLLR
jgi:hypothetical protein